MPVISCSKCETKNRVELDRAAAGQAKCGKCGAPLDISKASNQADNKPLIVTDATFEHEVLGAGSTPVLVDCWAPWCGPCRMVGPIMDQLAAESRGRYRIAKLNVDDNQQTSLRFNIGSIPTMLIFKDGKLVD